MSFYFPSEEEIGCFAWMLLIACIVFLCTTYHMQHKAPDKQPTDVIYEFDTAVIRMPDGTSQTVQIKSWCCYPNCDKPRQTIKINPGRCDPDDGQLQLTLLNDEVWLVHSDNCILMKTK